MRVFGHFDQVLYDMKAWNVPITSLGHNEYCYVSHCDDAKAIHNTLQVTFEGTTKMKHSMIYTFTKEYEHFRMMKSLRIYKRYLVILSINLLDLVKLYLVLKILTRFWDIWLRGWQPKVTAIEE